jgi:HAMP domain-containing protein
MKALKIFFILFLLLTVFGGAYLAFIEAPLEQQTTAVSIPSERYIK